MGISIIDKSGWRVVQLEGEFNLYTVRVLKEAIFNSINTSDLKILIDMRKVTYMDSNALGVMYAAQKKLHDAGRELHVTTMAAELSDVMRIIGLKIKTIDIDSIE